MKKIFTLITALTLSVGLWATSIWSGSHDVTGTNSLKIDASKFASALPGNKLTLSISVNGGTSDAIEFRANGQKLPGTRFSLCQEWWETYDLFMTQDMIDSCKVYGMEICGNNLTVTDVDLGEGKAASMKEGKVIWTGYSWVDSWSTLEVFKEALTAVKDWDKYKTMRFYSECPSTDNLIWLRANWVDADIIAKSDAGNSLKRYEGYAELDLTKVNPLTVINALSSDRLILQMDKQGSAAFNFTDVVLLEGPEENVYGITVNGTPVLGIKNEIPQDPSFEEWFVLNQSLKKGDLVTLYNQNGGTTWVVPLDKASVPGIELNATGDAYIITQDGGYDFYMKIKFGADQLYVGYCAAPPVPASGPTVDETGITVNGRKYGFPVRLVKEVK